MDRFAMDSFPSLSYQSSGSSGSLDSNKTPPFLTLPKTSDLGVSRLNSDSATPSDSSSPLISVLFNIELYGDPAIHWKTYYDFIVAKGGAYYQLREGYLPAEKHPSLVPAEKVTVGSRNLHPCCRTGCNAKPFTRYRDLERHFATVHQGGKPPGGTISLHCDYKKCARIEPFRKDHLREHYREYHWEDLIRRGQPKRSSLNGMRKGEGIEEFLASRLGTLSLSWWRCSRCIQRVQVSLNRYLCPTCNVACEPEREGGRENARIRRSDPQDDFVIASSASTLWFSEEKDQSL